MTRQGVVRGVEGSLDEGRDGGLMKFEVGGRQVRWKTRDAKWNGGLRWKGNFGGLLQGRAEEVRCHCPACREAGEVGHVNSDGGIRI